MFPSATYVQRRQALRARLGKGLVLLPGHRESPMNYADNAYPFRQESSFLYFFGLAQPDLMGLLDLDGGTDHLFGDDLSIHDIVWTGPVPTLAERAAQVGVTKTHPRAELAGRIQEALRQGRPVHFLNPSRAETALDLAELLSLAPEAVKAKTSAALAEAVVALRLRKEKAEVAEIESALQVTARMHLAAFRASKPGVVEREVVGIMEGIMRAEDLQLAYPVIFSRRGEVLHNHHHDQVLNAGDLVVNDTGCSSALGYASDITRTIPVGGKFSPLQRDLYNLVLDAEQSVIQRLKPGIPYVEMHKLAVRILVEGLKGMGFFQGDPSDIVESGAYAIVFQCGLGHAMGLDVHDMEGVGETFVGYGDGYTRSPLFGMKSLRMAKPLVEHTVVTVEPGIYIIPHLLDLWQAEGRHKDFIRYDRFDTLRGFGGIRIEDDVLVTAEGHRVLGPHIARTADEVEAAMSH